MLWCPRYWALKLQRDINVPPLMPNEDEDKYFRGSLVLDFRKWWRRVKTICLLYGFQLSHIFPGLEQEISYSDTQSQSSGPGWFVFQQDARLSKIQDKARWLIKMLHPSSASPHEEYIYIYQRTVMGSQPHPLRCKAPIDKRALLGAHY